MSLGGKAKSYTSAQSRELTVVLLGKNYHDKVQIVNTIVGKDYVIPQISTYKDIVLKTDQKVFHTIITPDLYHGLSQGHYQNLMSHSVSERLSPSYVDARVFLLILQNGHVSSEELEMFTSLKKYYGEKMVESTVVVLIRRKDDASKTLMAAPDKHVERVLRECSGRVCSFSPGMRSSELTNQLFHFYSKIIQQEKREPESLYENADDLYDELDKNAGEDKIKQTEGKPPVPVPFWNKSNKSRNQMTIVLFGHTGSGKSATGNTLLAKHHFKSCASSTIVTQECEVADEQVCGLTLKVIDTPDFFNEDLNDSKMHIQKCKEFIQSEHVVYLLVMHLGRFTDGDREFASKLKKAFGENMIKNTLILFTAKEKLKGENIDDYVRNAENHLQELIKTFGGRYHAISNNDNEKSRQQVKELLEVIIKMQCTDHSKIKEHFPGYSKQDCILL